MSNCNNYRTSQANIPEEFPASESWWPPQHETLTDEWELPEQKVNFKEKKQHPKFCKKKSGQQLPISKKRIKDEICAARSLPKRNQEYHREKNDLLLEEEKASVTKLVPITINKRLVQHTSNKKRYLKVGKEETRKTFVVPKSLSPVKIYIDCTPGKFENHLVKFGDVLPPAYEKKVRNDSQQNNEDGNSWVFYKTTTRITSQLPQSTYGTYSYEINYEHVYYIPENGPNIELYIGTIRQ